MTASDEWFEGGCHCGEVRFRIRLAEHKAIECNCSMCAKKGFINLIATEEDFELLQGEASLGMYQFNTMIAQHRFCKICGIHVFTRPRSHPDGYDINGRCLDQGHDFLEISPFDGQNWEESVASIRGES